MDRTKLQELIEQIKRHKVWVLVGGVLLIFIIVVIVLLPQGSSKQPNQQGQTTSTPTDASGQKQLSLVPSNIPKWKANTQAGVQFQSPPDWMVRKAPISSGGNYILVQPTILPPNVVYPRFTLETVPYNAEQMAVKAEILAAFGLKESQTTVDGIPARKFSGGMSGDVAKGENLDGPLQETAILFQYNNKMYTLKYNYVADAPNPDLEDYFGEIIKTIKIK